jgi:Protein of unknown function (DUF2934)
MPTPEEVTQISQEMADAREQAIRERAYQIYEIRGRENGHAEEDWYLAESELFGAVAHREAA